MILDTVLYDNVTLWNIVGVVITFVVALIILQILTVNLKRRLSEKIQKNELEIILKVVRFTIIILAVLSVLPLLSINLTGIALAGGFAGLVIGFASQSVVSNLVSGIFLVIERPIKIGDQIQIESVEGFVEDIRFLSTVMRSYDGEYVRLPNEKVFTSIITNYVADVARRFDYTIGISYRDDADRAISIIREILEDCPYVLRSPVPDVYVQALGDNSVNIKMFIWAPSSEWFATKKALLWRIKARFDTEGIEIPFPQRVLWFGKEEPPESAGKGREP